MAPTETMVFKWAIAFKKIFLKVSAFTIGKMHSCVVRRKELTVHEDSTTRWACVFDEWGADLILKTKTAGALRHRMVNFCFHM